MSGEPVRNDTPERPEPYLRLVEVQAAASDRANSHGHDASAWDGQPAGHTAHVLVAGADTAACTRMLHELRDLLPTGTRFAHASETWEVIAGASTSSMVVLAGDLGDVSEGSMMRLLGRRYPSLPVLAVAEKTPTQPAADVDVAYA